MNTRAFLATVAFTAATAACDGQSTFIAGPDDPGGKADGFGDGGVSSKPLVRAKRGALRVATYNLMDARTDAIKAGDDERLRTIAATIQAIHPDILVINEMDYEQPGTPGYVDGDPIGQNAKRFAENYLSVAQREGLEALDYHAYMFATNTGLLTGFDLDNDGTIADADTALQDERAYGGDCYGFGEYPGKYAFALFVRSDFEVDEASVRSFQNLRWSAMPDALAPTDPETDKPFYTDEEWAALRLSSKNHVDIVVKVDTGETIHFLLSHPTPPVFDGKEDRNGKRNHDEIRLWGDYLNGESYLVDDQGATGGLAPGENFLIMGDMNSDLDEGDSVDNPMGTFIFSNPRVAKDYIPRAPANSPKIPKLSRDDTAHFGARIDYIVRSVGLRARAAGVVRPLWPEAEHSSDHLPVWLDLDFESSP